jgi:hypothetical protein
LEDPDLIVDGLRNGDRSRQGNQQVNVISGAAYR